MEEPLLQRGLEAEHLKRPVNLVVERWVVANGGEGLVDEPEQIHGAAVVLHLPCDLAEQGQSLIGLFLHLGEPGSTSLAQGHAPIVGGEASPEGVCDKSPGGGLACATLVLRGAPDDDPRGCPVEPEIQRRGHAEGLHEAAEIVCDMLPMSHEVSLVLERLMGREHETRLGVTPSVYVGRST